MGPKGSPGTPSSLQMSIIQPLEQCCGSGATFTGSGFDPKKTGFDRIRIRIRNTALEYLNMTWPEFPIFPIARKVVIFSRDEKQFRKSRSFRGVSFLNLDNF